MHLRIGLLALCFALARVNAQDQDKCPKRDYACLDVINSSQCIEQLVLDHHDKVTKSAMVKCVESEGSASNLPGAAKVSSRMRGKSGSLGHGKNTRTNIEIVVSMLGLPFGPDKCCNCRIVPTTLWLDKV